MQCVCAILSSVACSAVQYFSTLSHKRNDFRENNAEHTKRVLIFSTTFTATISHSKNNSGRYYHMYIGLCVKCPLVLTDFNET
jgi:hypothetical protein